MKKILSFWLILFITLIFSGTAEGSVLRVAGETSPDSYVSSFTLELGETIAVGIWLDATDTTVNGVECYFRYDTLVLELQDTDGDSISVGTNIWEDHTYFGDILKNQSVGDTIDYAALTDTGVVFNGDGRVATMTFKGIAEEDSVPIRWCFETALNRVTRVSQSDDGSDVLTGVDTGYISVVDSTGPDSPEITFGEALADSVYLEWTAVTDLSGILGYNVYRATNVGTFTKIVSLISDTYYYDTDVIPGNTYYYRVSATDNSVSQNEGALSDSVTVPHITVTKSVYSVTLSGAPTKVVPGASIIYQLYYTSDGYGPGDSIVIFDNIPSFVEFSETVTQPPGWTVEFEDDNANPDQSYISVDYNDTPNSNILWIRWKKIRVSAGDTGIFRYKCFVK